MNGYNNGMKWVVYLVFGVIVAAGLILGVLDCLGIVSVAELKQRQ